MLRSFFTRLPSGCLPFKRCLPFSPQQHKRLLSTTTANVNDRRIGDVVPFIPLGTRGTKQECSRRRWTKEEDELLKTLYAQHGPKYTLISRQFPGRIVSTVYQRCKYLFDPQYKMLHGPWKKEEIAALRTLVEEATKSSHQLKAGAPINWETIQHRLPYPRELSHIKLTWYHTINPQWQRGRWTQHENDRFQQLVRQEGTTDWRKISTLLQTRSPRQCLEKYRHNIAPIRKGQFTPQEDADLMAAVNTYGDGDFLHIKQVLSSQRTPRQLAKRYRYAMDPAYDRSEWTEKERLEMYRLALELDGDMNKVKERMNSKRHTSDMWNHFKRVSQAAKKNKNKNHSSDQHGKISQDINKGPTYKEGDAQ